MASSTDTRAAGFNAAEFRDAIKFAMHMGLPETESERATFRWNVERTFTVSDAGGVPFEKGRTPCTEVEHADGLVDVAVEFTNIRGTEATNAVGQFNTARAVITVLDEDYALIEGANMVLLGGNTYDIKFVRPPVGLFAVTVYQLDCEARDET